MVTLGLKTAFSRDASGFRFGWRLGASDETGKMNRFAKFSLVATSIAPVFLTMWFVEFSRGWNWLDGWEYLALTLLLTVLCWVLLQMVRTRLDVLNLEIVSVKTADNEMIGFVLAYLLPLINRSATKTDPWILVFVLCLLFVVVLTSNSYHFNPLVGFLGYHFYDVTLAGGVSYVLISRRNIRDCKSIKSVGHFSEYMIMEV